MRFVCFLVGCDQPDGIVGSPEDICKRCKAPYKSQYTAPISRRLRTLLFPSDFSVTNKPQAWSACGYKYHYDAPVCGYFAKVEVERKEFWDYPQPFKNGDTVFVLGDIDMMPGHSVIVTDDGRIHLAYHTDYFRKLREDEL